MSASETRTYGAEKNWIGSIFGLFQQNLFLWRQTPPHRIAARLRSCDAYSKVGRWV